MAKVAKARDVRELPESVGFKPDSKGVMSLVDGTNFAPSQRLATESPIMIATAIKDMLAHKVAINQYAFFAPKYDANGEAVKAKDAKGNFILSPSGKAITEQVELARAIKETEEGKREAILTFGKFGTFKVLLVTKQEKATRQPREAFDLAAFYAAKVKK